MNDPADKERFGQVVIAIRKQLTDYGLNAPSNINIRSGYKEYQELWAPLAVWKKRPKITAYIGNYLIPSGREFWFGFESPRLDQVEDLIADAPLRPIEYLTIQSLHDKWYSRSQVEKFGGVARETFSKDAYKFFGVYVSSECTDEEVVNRGTEFILRMVDYIDPSLSERHDIKALDKNETDYKALVLARRGQGKFRRALEEIWDEKCAVHGCAAREVLRASHIKPWRDSNDKERLDPNNGLLLSATLDALFDRALISFDNNGNIKISSRLSPGDRTSLRLDRLKLRKPLSKEQKEYLSAHREQVF